MAKLENYYCNPLSQMNKPIKSNSSLISILDCKSTEIIRNYFLNLIAISIDDAS